MVACPRSNDSMNIPDVRFHITNQKVLKYFISLFDKTFLAWPQALTMEIMDIKCRGKFTANFSIQIHDFATVAAQRKIPHSSILKPILTFSFKNRFF